MKAEQIEGPQYRHEGFLIAVDERSRVCFIFDDKGKHLSTIEGLENARKQIKILQFHKRVEALINE